MIHFRAFIPSFCAKLLLLLSSLAGNMNLVVYCLHKIPFRFFKCLLLSYTLLLNTINCILSLGKHGPPQYQQCVSAGTRYYGTTRDHMVPAETTWYHQRPHGTKSLLYNAVGVCHKSLCHCMRMFLIHYCVGADNYRVTVLLTIQKIL